MSRAIGPIPHRQAVSAGTRPATEGHTEDSRLKGISHWRATSVILLASCSVDRRSFIGGLSEILSSFHRGPFFPSRALILCSSSSAVVSSGNVTMIVAVTLWGTRIGEVSVLRSTVETDILFSREVKVAEFLELIPRPAPGHRFLRLFFLGGEHLQRL